MDDNVIEIVSKQFDLERDIKEFVKEIGEAEAFSSQKVHLQMLLAEICASEQASDEVRQSAARALIKTSDITAAIRMVPDNDLIVAEFWERMGQNVGIRR